MKIIDLKSHAGNSFILLAYAKQYAEQLDLDHEAIYNEMTEGDYDNLIAVFEKYFGDYVKLINKNG
jgi:hypothetical protein